MLAPFRSSAQERLNPAFDILVVLAPEAKSGFNFLYSKHACAALHFYFFLA
jgi:hypothetical protein